jgi:hypothetical protein
VSVSLHTLAERPDLADDPGRRTLHEVWPEFAKHDRVVNRYIGRAITEHPRVQVVAWDDELQRVVAEGNTVPVRWPGSPPPGGVDWALTQRYEEAGEPTTLCALQVMIAAERQGSGLSALMLKRMTLCASETGLDALVAPVRPTLKPRYPLVPMERYVDWRRDDGQLLDPWLRTHERIGASFVAIAPESMRIEGSAASWEEWTGLVFPEDGSYVVDGALVPVEFSGDHGLYIEPNVWMRHPLP